MDAAGSGGPRKGLAAGLGQEHAQKLEDIVSNSSEGIQNVWNKYGDEITVASTTASRGKCNAAGQIFVHLENDIKDTTLKPSYETTMHESGHSIDRAISRKLGYRFSEKYKDGLFEKTLIDEANSYIKNRQKQMEEDLFKQTGRKQKVPIQQVRDAIGKELRKGGALSTGDVSDVFEGATKGKLQGSAGHGKTYWTGGTMYGWKVPGHSVAVEAFAEMFSASTVNPKSREQFNKYFPKSYQIFNDMIAEA